MTNRYYPGDTIPVNFTHRDSAGTLVNADTVSLCTRLNDEEGSTATPTNTGTGTYSATLTPSASGVIRFTFSATYNSQTTTRKRRIKVHEAV